MSDKGHNSNKPISLPVGLNLVAGLHDPALATLLARYPNLEWEHDTQESSNDDEWYKFIGAPETHQA